MTFKFCQVWICDRSLLDMERGIASHEGMSDDPNPYAAGATSPEIPSIPSRPPAQIRVLAILHLVFGGIGLIGTAFGLVMQVFSKSILAGSGEAGPEVKMQQAMAAAGQTHQYLSAGFSVLLAILLLVAGVGLLKNKLTGLKVSNVYAWISIASKVALGVLFFTHVLPALNTAIEGMLGSAAKADQGVLSIAKMTMVVSGVVTPLVSCIYPILVLVLLNRESVRKHLR